MADQIKDLGVGLYSWIPSVDSTLLVVAIGESRDDAADRIINHLASHPDTRAQIEVLREYIKVHPPLRIDRSSLFGVATLDRQQVRIQP
jgi:hypothetical protein